MRSVPRRRSARDAPCPPHSTGPPMGTTRLRRCPAIPPLPLVRHRQHWTDRPRRRAQRRPVPPTTLLPATPSRRRARRSSTTGCTGTALCDIVAEEGEREGVLLAKGARGLFVYPMVPDGHDDTLRMRLKRVDPANAKLSYHWVAVYNGDTAEPCISHFGFLP